MMKTKTLLFGLVALMSFNVSVVRAQWEPTGFTQSSVWVLGQAQNGNLIAADDIYPDRGGIYLSQDAGETWTKTNALDYSYTSHLVKDENVYLGGIESIVAISHNHGETWSNVDFKNLLPEASENTPIYAMEYHNGRIYAAVLSLGIAYSEDNGITWQLTDVESLLDENNPEDGGQWCYNLRSYKGKLYNVGAFGIWEYNEDADLWSNVDETWYGGSTCIAEDVFYVVYNAQGIPDGIRYTTDFQEWEVMPIPDGVSTSFRFMEYHKGAFFLGHVSEAIFYTMDKGETWIEYRENFPGFSPVPGINFYGTPMGLTFAGNNMFCGVFSPDEGVGGIYMAPVPDEVTDVIEMPANFQPRVYPNPANDFVLLQFPKGEKNHGSLIITDITGRVKYNKTIQNEGGNAIAIPTRNWLPGFYLYTITTGESKASGKFIVE
jgi:photosystem II stability/assembly factor-like uncharacterized protein